MASSEKAGALKDAFVNAIADNLGEEKMAQAGAMENAKLAGKLGLPVGNQASVLMDLGNQYETYTNDGDRNVYIRGTDGRIGAINDNMRTEFEKHFTDSKHAGRPIGTRGSGYEGGQPMSIGRQKMFQDMLNEPLLLK